MLYHPDKHRDPELKSQAEQLFNQVHQAYEGEDALDLDPLQFQPLNWTQTIRMRSTGSIQNATQNHLHKPNCYFSLSPQC